MAKASSAWTSIRCALDLLHRWVTLAMLARWSSGLRTTSGACRAGPAGADATSAEPWFAAASGKPGLYDHNDLKLEY